MITKMMLVILLLPVLGCIPLLAKTCYWCFQNNPKVSHPAKSVPTSNAAKSQGTQSGGQ